MASSIYGLMEISTMVRNKPCVVVLGIFGTEGWKNEQGKGELENESNARFAKYKSFTSHAGTDESLRNAA